MSKIYLCRQHTQVGDELIHMATTNKDQAEQWAEDNNLGSGTINYDVVECDDGKIREDI